MHRLILWDVDGTLVRTGGAGAAVFDVAVERVLGVDVRGHGVRMSGKTDPQIAREILAIAEVGESDAEEALHAVLEHIETALAGAVERIRAEGHVLPGVEEILERLHRDEGVLQSLLTGNIAPNALVKIGAFGLDRWFDLDVGAYGSDHHDREELVAIARHKARDRHGVDFESDQTWVIGDTPRDLACARAGGVRCLLVGTGRYDVSELEGLGADAVLADLSEVDRVLELLAS